MDGYMGLVLFILGAGSLLYASWKKEDYARAESKGPRGASRSVRLVSSWGGIIVGVIFMLTSNWKCN